MLSVLDILAALSPVDRFHAVKSPYEQPVILMKLWIPILCVVAAAVATLLILLYRRWSAHQQGAVRLRAMADELGLTREERSMLVRIGKLAGAGGLEGVLTREAAFSVGAAALMQNEPVVSLPPQVRSRIGAVVVSLRQKLGFVSQMDVKTKAQVASVPFVEGAAVEITVQGDPSTYAAVVQRADGTDVTFETEVPVAAKPDDFCRVRYGTEGTLWECDAFVVASSPVRLVLRLAGCVRTMDLRRFPRVAIQAEAWIAPFPLVKDGEAEEAPVFVQATLTEVGGPGVRLETPLRAEEGDRVLVTLKFRDGWTLQGIGRVRRATLGDDGVSRIAVELIGLTQSELVELMRETKRAAQRVAGGPEQAELTVPQASWPD